MAAAAEARHGRPRDQRWGVAIGWWTRPKSGSPRPREAVAAAKASQATRMASAAASSGSLATDRGHATALSPVTTKTRPTLDAAAPLRELRRAAIAAQTRLDEARAAVSNAANAVIADEALTPTIERCRALRAELDAQTLKLSAAINRELASLKFLSDNREKVTTLQTIESVGHPSFQITGVEWPRAEEIREASRIIDSERKVVDMSVQRPVREAWAKARADLHSDPDAALPCFLTSFVRGAN